MDDFLASSAGMTLDGVLDRIRAPFLVLHGENDRQISVDYARQTYDQLVNAAAPRTQDRHRRARAGSSM